MDKTILKIVGMRFARGFVSGALSAVGVVSVTVPGAWTELPSAVGAVVLAVLTGGLSGGLLALDKWLRSA